MASKLEDVARELALSLLDENWKEREQGRAAQSDNPANYHVDRAERHDAIADFHQHAGRLAGMKDSATTKLSHKHGLGPKSYHLRKETRHRALADAHDMLAKQADLKKHSPK